MSAHHAIHPHPSPECSECNPRKRARETIAKVEARSSAPVLITPELQFRTMRTALAAILQHGMRPDLVEAGKHALEISGGLKA